MISKQNYYGEFNWRTSLWSDQAGYYGYTPALLIYDFDVSKFPKDIVKNTGWGFEIKNNKFDTRYTYGVALLQAPFFLGVHAYNSFFGLNVDGFTGNYSKIPTLATIFYFLVAILLLFRILKYRHGKIIAVLALSIIIFGTNLYFYLLNYNGFSHIYSFFLFALFFLFLEKYRTKRKFYFLLFLTLILSLCVLIRPTNILMLLAVFMVWDKEDFISLKKFFRVQYILVVLIIGIIPFIPQFMYWNYLSGKLIYYSYGSKGFSFWTNPQILKTWFSPKNGLFPYNPIYFAFIIIWVFVLRIRNLGLASFGIFIVLSYLCASWYLFHFGCGYGNRNFVEYTCFFVFPVASFIDLKIHRLLKYFVYSLLILGVMINLKLVRSYDFCFQGNDWEYAEYQKILSRSYYSESLDFTLGNGLGVQLDSSWSYSPEIEISQEMVSAECFGRCKVDVTIKTTKNLPVNARIVLSIDSLDKVVDWQTTAIGELKQKYDDWERIKWTFTMPKNYPLNSHINCYIWTPSGDSLLIRDLNVNLE